MNNHCVNITVRQVLPQLPTKCRCNNLQKVFAILCKKGLQKTGSAYQGSPVPSEAAFFHSMREALLLWLPIAPAVVKEAG